MKILPKIRGRLAEPFGKHEKGATLAIGVKVDSTFLGEKIINIPEFALVYLNFAENELAYLKRIKKKLSTEKYSSDRMDTYLQKASVVLILLYSALESALNTMLPPDAVYKREKTGDKEYTKEEAERRFSIEDKIKEYERLKGLKILETNYWKQFKKIKDLRDEMIHPKASKKITDYYQPVIQNMVEMDYNFSYNSVFHLILILNPKFFNWDYN